jgi:hypothetical protein
MATNPLGLYRSGDSITDLDAAFDNLQYLRDSLPQISILGTQLTFVSDSYLPLSNKLAARISSRVRFEASVYLNAPDVGCLLSVNGPDVNYLRYEVSAPASSYRTWNSGGTQLKTLYRLVGVCEPSVPGLLQVTMYTDSVSVSVHPLSNLVITLL